MRIVVVDDNQDGADSMASALKLLHHEVRTAYNGSSAVRLCGTFRPDLVLLDIMMSGIDGYETCRVVRRLLGTTVRIIAITGIDALDHQQRAAEAGFDALWSKPVDWGLLKRELERLTALARSDHSS